MEDTQDCANKILRVLIINSYVNILTLENLGVTSDLLKKLKQELEDDL